MKPCWIFDMLLLVCILIGISSVHGQPPDTNLKVMTYNIWNGFDWGKDTVRRAEWVRWVREKNPDVLALQELCGYDEEQLKADAAKWGHSYAVILKTDGYPVGLTSRQPIELKKKVIEDLWHGMLHVVTYDIDFFVVHLSPADSDFRLREANIIGETIRESKSGQYIILGDFNAHSPFDSESMKNKQALLDKYRAGVSDKYSNLRLGEFDYSVISLFLGLPAIDVSQLFIDVDDRYTFPTPVLLGSYRETMDEVIETRERIDYILTSPVLSKSCSMVKIFNQGEAEIFSDHYPVMAEFNFAFARK